MIMNFTGKTAISTGAASGMGLLFAQNWASLGGNVTTVHHERSNCGLGINGCYLRVELETRNHEHVEQIRQGLKNVGFKLID